MSVTNAKLTPNWSILAGTRFCLAMVVLLSHMGGYHHFKPFQIHGATPVSLAHFIGSMGAVMAFFMISGYSIAHSITNRPQRFLLRRFWRIWPTYLFCFFAFTLPVTLFASDTSLYASDTSNYQIIGNALLLQGLFTRVIEINAASWSLAIEEFLYLFSPIFKRLPIKILFALLAISSIAYMLSERLEITRYAGEIGGRGILCCAWAWLVGFIYYQHSDKLWAKNLIIFLPVFLMGCYNQLPGKIQCATVLAVSLLLIYSPYINLVSMRWNRFLVWLGNISYPIYICHATFGALCVFLLETMHLPIDEIWNAHPYRSIILVIAMSAAIYHFIDKPNRDRWKNPLPQFTWYSRHLKDSMKPASSKTLDGV